MYCITVKTCLENDEILPVVRHDDWTDQNNTTNYQFQAKMTKYLRKLKAKRMYFIKKRKDCGSIIHLCLFVKMVY